MIKSKRGTGGGSTRSRDEVGETRRSKGVELFGFQVEPTQREELKKKVKSFVIDKRLVAEAWKRVKANRGSAGVDNIGIEEFEARLEDNLYKVSDLLTCSRAS